MKRTMNRKNNLLITHCFLVSTGTWLRKGWYSPQPRSITPRENDGLLITPLLSCPWTVSYCSMQARIQGRWNGWIFTSLFLSPLLSFCWCTDLKHLNQALILLHYYKNSPPISEFWIRACYDGVLPSIMCTSNLKTIKS